MTKKFLHVGCGQNTKEKTTPVFNTNEWEEVRLDIDENLKPDIIASLTDMSSVEDASYDAVYSSHNIEHVYPYEVNIALKEMYRVLNDTGFVVITCPDIQEVSKFIADDKFTEPLYESPAGPISPVDIVYGHRRALSEGKHYMAHKTGFTAKVLAGELSRAGFPSLSVAKNERAYSLWAVATKNSVSSEEVNTMLKQHWNGT